MRGIKLSILVLTAITVCVLPWTAAATPRSQKELPDVELAAVNADATTADDVFVRFTLTNNGAAPMSVYVWETPLRGVENDIFVVTRDGQPVTYLGIVAKRMAPGAGDFVRLAPGQSRSTVVELSALYDMSQPGSYDVAYRAKRSDVLPEDTARTGEPLGSNGVNIRLSGEARRSPLEPLSSPAPLAGGAVYRECSNTQISTLADVLPAARNYASSASSYVNSHSSGARYTTWFGATNTGRYNTVKGDFAAISSALSTQTITFDCKCKKPYYAYVYPTRPYEIFLCKVFWQAPLTGTDSKAGTVIHETSHFNVVAGTDDWVYGQSGCQQLAIDNPDHAVNNADSHEYYAENDPAKQ